MPKTITISGQNFEISTPYAEGHTVTAIEAKVLNQTRAENIGNNFRKAVAEAVEKGNLSEVTAAIAAYDAGYTFSAGGVARVPVDPIEAEAIRIAKAVVAGKIKEKYNSTLKAYLAIEGNQDKYDAAVEKTAQQDDTLKLARKAVADKKKKMEVAADDLGI